MTHQKLVVMVGLLAVANCGDDAEEEIATTVQEVRTGRGGMVGVDVLVTDGAGDAIPCGVGTLTVTVEASRAGGAYVAVGSQDVLVQCHDTGANVALVVDNSGSEARHVAQLQTAARGMLDGVLAAGGQASYVRVSTNAAKQVELTADAAALNAAIDGMRVNKGFTALYDGIRLGNETLGGALLAADDASPTSDVRAFCQAARKTGIVVFSDGRENNSSDENANSYDLGKYPGDGFATTLGDLHKLRIGGVTTPIYAIGLGRDVDAAGLSDLATVTGGKYLHTDEPAELPHLFDQVREYLGASHQVCVDLPQDECGDVDLRISYAWSDGKRTIRRRAEQTVTIPCPQKLTGNVATVLLAMSNPGISSTIAETLAAQAVDYVSPAAVAPSVLVVRDDGHHNEYKDDPLYVRDLLQRRGYRVTFIEEPAGGLRPSDIGSHSVVWFSNPGYPMDDQRSFDTLRAHSAAGGGVVLQGDDMSWGMGRSFSMTPMTQLEHVDNGTSACGTTIDNNRGGAYRVAVANSSHPMVGVLAGAQFGYGDDIDLTTAIGGADVLASASYARGSCAVNTPVLVGYAPPRD